MTNNIDDVKKKAEERYRKACIFKLSYIGESVVKHARMLPNPPASMLAVSKSGEKRAVKGHQPNYFDWTSNLRSSIGFVIVDRGSIVKSSPFETIKGGSEGSSEGRQFANSLASKMPPDSISLIVVAGMSYATYVQRKGYDVTASAELLAEQLIKQMKLNATITHPQ